jgi:nicotinate phosphoribosyltransferase
MIGTPGHSLDSALLTDLYQLTMLQGYYDRGMNEPAVFEFFVRRLPEERGFLMAAGLDPLLDFLDRLHFTPADLDWLRESGHFSNPFIESLRSFRFTGDVHAVPEGTVVFADEPIVRVTAPLPQAQLIETRLINLLHFHVLIASKAARSVLAAPGKTLVDFGLRRAHGAEAGLFAARACYIAGFTGTSNVLASQVYGIPAFGTMAHSFIEAHDDETQAFAAFADSQKDNTVLLIDTYDTERAAQRVVELAPRLRERGIRIKGVRLDSGDLLELSRRVRDILDQGGLREATIFCSGSLDEHIVRRLLESGAPIDGFGIGTRLDTSSDAPYLDCAYKLQEYAGVPRRKRSAGKATWPGRKQVYRLYDEAGCMRGDAIVLEGERCEGQPLLVPVMKNGQRLSPPEPLATIRRRAAGNLAALPAPLARLQSTPAYEVIISERLRALAAALDERASTKAQATSSAPS